MNRTRPRPPLCKCGHPEQTHYSLNTGIRGGSCQATVYEAVHMGVNAHPCRCLRFEVAR